MKNYKNENTKLKKQLKRQKEKFIEYRKIAIDLGKKYARGGSEAVDLENCLKKWEYVDKYTVYAGNYLGIDTVLIRSGEYMYNRKIKGKTIYDFCDDCGTWTKYLLDKKYPICLKHLKKVFEYRKKNKIGQWGSIK